MNLFCIVFSGFHVLFFIILETHLFLFLDRLSLVTVFSLYSTFQDFYTAVLKKEKENRYKMS